MTKPTGRPRPTTRKSLRQSLKDLLQRRRRQPNVQAGQVGSGILRRAGTGIYLPEPSRVSLFPNFESSSQFDIDSFSVHIPNHFANEAEPVGEALSSSLLVSQASLLPARSLSQFNLTQRYVEHGRSCRPSQLTTVPEIFVEGASRQASLVSLHTLKPSTSTLRIRESKQSLRSDAWSQSRVSFASTCLTSQPRWRESLSDLRSLASFHTNTEDTAGCLAQPPTAGRPEGSEGRGTTFSDPSITSIKHFDSFCVLDTSAPGCPVTATSEDLKYVFDVGEHFFLNNEECADASMDIVTGFDADGNEITHLVLFSPLISPSSGRSRFLLAALIDVTVFIKDAAKVPELDTISEESVLEEGVITPPAACNGERHPMMRGQPASRASSALFQKNVAKYELSSEDLLGGCYVVESRTTEYFSVNDHGTVPGSGNYADMKQGLTPTFDDIWIDLAEEEMICRRRASPSLATSMRSSPRIAQTSHALLAPSCNTSQVDHVLDSFMSELQQLYSDFFLLAKSPLDAGFYEICNVSPSEYVTKDYVRGHLSHSAPSTITRLSELLSGETAFDMSVRWGISGDIKQLYCIPLFGQRDLTWVCMLVDVKLGPLW